MEQKLHISLSLTAAKVILSKCHTDHVDALLNSSLVSSAFGSKVNSLIRPAQFGSSSHSHFQLDLDPSHTDCLSFPHSPYASPCHRAFALAFSSACSSLPPASPG